MLFTYLKLSEMIAACAVCLKCEEVMVFIY